jgi:hypothetical protein
MISQEIDFLNKKERWKRNSPETPADRFSGRLMDHRRSKRAVYYLSSMAPHELGQSLPFLVCTEAELNAYHAIKSNPGYHFRTSYATFKMLSPTVVSKHQNNNSDMVDDMAISCEVPGRKLLSAGQSRSNGLLRCWFQVSIRSPFKVFLIRNNTTNM